MPIKPRPSNRALPGSGIGVVCFDTLLSGIGVMAALITFPVVPSAFWISTLKKAWPLEMRLAGVSATESAMGVTLNSRLLGPFAV